MDQLDREKKGSGHVVGFRCIRREEEILRMDVRLLITLAKN